jgi:hypothetical protein
MASERAARSSLWIQPMAARDRREAHRAAAPLELIAAILVGSVVTTEWTQRDR